MFSIGPDTMSSIGPGTMFSIGPGERQESKSWRQVSSTIWRAEFKNARALRSPTSAGVRWDNVERIETRSAPSGNLICNLFPARDKLSEREACCNIGGCSDITVMVEVNDKSEVEPSLRATRGRTTHVPPAKRVEIIRHHRDWVLAATRSVGHFPWLQAVRAASRKHVSFSKAVSLNSLSVIRRTNFETSRPEGRCRNNKQIKFTFAKDSFNGHSIDESAFVDV